MIARLIGTLAIAGIASIAVSAQALAYKTPRTPDGQPDPQGFWSNATYTPLERPDNVTKEFYTPEEALAAEKAAPRVRMRRPILERSPTCTTTSRSSD